MSRDQDTVRVGTTGAGDRDSARVSRGPGTVSMGKADRSSQNAGSVGIKFEPQGASGKSNCEGSVLGCIN